MKFRVPVKTVTTEIFLVEAENAEKAMNLVLDDYVRGGYCESIEEINGDPEVYYPDIREEKE